MEQLFSSVVKRSNPKILAVGKNYLPANSPNAPLKPTIYTKSLSSILYKGELLVLNTKSQINYEIELGVLIGKTGKNISRSKALNHIGGYFLCLDITDFTILKAAQSSGAPWDISKSQDGFLPISDFVPKDQIEDPQNVVLSLVINKEQKVYENTQNMLFKVDKIIEYCSSFMTLNQGDLIITGTPKLGPLFNGDKVEACLSYKEKKLAEIALDVIISS